MILFQLDFRILKVNIDFAGDRGGNEGSAVFLEAVYGFMNLCYQRIDFCRLAVEEGCYGALLFN